MSRSKAIPKSDGQAPKAARPERSRRRRMLGQRLDHILGEISDMEALQESLVNDLSLLKYRRNQIVDELEAIPSSE
jgi:hypothetical protein